MLYLGGREWWVEAPQVLRLRELGRGEEGLGVRGLLLGDADEDADEPAAAVGQLVGAAPVQQTHAWGPGKTLGGPKRFRWNLKPGERLALDNC
jgi:hypothetical protein